MLRGIERISHQGVAKRCSSEPCGPEPDPNSNSEPCSYSRRPYWDVAVAAERVKAQQSFQLLNQRHLINELNDVSSEAPDCSTVPKTSFMPNQSDIPVTGYPGRNIRNRTNRVKQLMTDEENKKKRVKELLNQCPSD